MLTRKESVTPILTCEDEDIALALMDANPAINMMDIRQQFDGVTKPAAAGHEIGSAREKYVMGKLTCHNPHQTLRYIHAKLVTNVFLHSVLNALFSS